MLIRIVLVPRHHLLGILTAVLNPSEVSHDSGSNWVVSSNSANSRFKSL